LMMSEGNGFVTRENALQQAKRRFAVVEIPDWGKFRLRSLTELERSRFENSMRDKRGQVSSGRLVDMKFRMIVLGCVDAEGNQLFRDSDIGELKNQDSKNTNALVEEIQKHWGMSDTDVEDLEKNYEPTAGDSSQ
jgi:hypothetical protein